MVTFLKVDVFSKPSCNKNPFNSLDSAKEEVLKKREELKRMEAEHSKCKSEVKKVQSVYCAYLHSPISELIDLFVKNMLLF